MHIARVGERSPRLQIQFRISRSFRPQNLANLGSKIRFWIRRKEHTLNEERSARFTAQPLSALVQTHSCKRQPHRRQVVAVSWEPRKSFPSTGVMLLYACVGHRPYRGA